MKMIKKSFWLKRIGMVLNAAHHNADPEEFLYEFMVDDEVKASTHLLRLCTGDLHVRP